MSELSAHEVLVKARNLIDKDGWWGSDLAEPGGQCAANAISSSNAGGGLHEAHGVLKRVLGALDLGEVFRWNDAPGRTKAEVFEAFDRAIASTAPAPADPLEGVDVREVVA